MAWAPDYATATELAEYLRINDTEDNTELGIAATSASRAIDNHCHRQFGQLDVAETWRYTAFFDRRRGRWVVEIDDTMTDPTEVEILPTEFSSPGDGTVVTGYSLEPRNAVAKDRPYKRIVFPDGASPDGTPYQVAVTAAFGWTSVPTAVKQATLLQASRFHARRFSPFGVAGSPETGSELRLLAKVDADVGVSLADYIRWWVAA